MFRYTSLENEKAIILSLRNAEPCWFGEGAHLTQSKVRWMWLTAEEFWSLKKRRKILFLSQKEIYVSNEYLALKTHKQYSDCMVIFTSSSYLLNFFKKSFNWRIIALQCCVGFYCIAMQISHNYICTLSLLSPYHPSRLSQNTRLYSLCYIEAPH